MIHRVTFLQMCECGQHGRFVLPDSSVGTEFCSRDDAIVELECMLSSDKIEEDEFRFLRDEVNRQGRLATTIGSASGVSQIVCKIGNKVADYLRGHLEDSTENSKYVM